MRQRPLTNNATSSTCTDHWVVEYDTHTIDVCQLSPVIRGCTFTSDRLFLSSKRYVVFNKAQREIYFVYEEEIQLLNETRPMPVVLCR